MSETRNLSLLGKITILVMVGFYVNTAVALDGSGTQEDPWQIKSLDDFNDFGADANYWDDYTRLETDVNLAGMVYTTAVIAPDVDNANYDFDGTGFTGIFDGNDHKITNLTIDDGGAGNDYLGLFGSIDDGEVRNLGLEGGFVSGDDKVGGLVGESNENLTNCYSTGDVNGDVFVGGLVGGSYGSISNCYSTGDVNGDVDVGGLVGIDYYFPGHTISNCYSTGDVSGNVMVGGVVGFHEGIISNCYSTGDVNSRYDVGGLIGWNFFGDISNCFWDIDTQTHGVTESIGDDQGTAINVVGLPTTEMQTRSTFTDATWDFITTWNIGENQTYPYLRVYLAGDINKDGIVNFLDLSITANQWMQEQ